MVMSTQISRDAAAVMAAIVLQDTVQIHNVGPVVTTGIHASRELEPVGDPIPGLVQTTVLANAVESQVTSVYSIKVAAGTVLEPGMAVEVISCELEPELVSKILLVDKVSQNGAALIRKAVASDYQTVNQEGKATL